MSGGCEARTDARRENESESDRRRRRPARLSFRRRRRGGRAGDEGRARESRPLPDGQRRLARQRAPGVSSASTRAPGRADPGPTAGVVGRSCRGFGLCPSDRRRRRRLAGLALRQRRLCTDGGMTAGDDDGGRPRQLGRVCVYVCVCGGGCPTRFRVWDSGGAGPSCQRPSRRRGPAPPRGPGEARPGWAAGPRVLRAVALPATRVPASAGGQVREEGCRANRAGWRAGSRRRLPPVPTIAWAKGRVCRQSPVPTIADIAGNEAAGPAGDAAAGGGWRRRPTRG